jgi:transcriptional regulator with XRE-family HTH domain
MKHGKEDSTRATSLGEHLQGLRLMLKEKKSIRQVAEETGISNAYLSQLERCVAENPSPHVLHKLAEYYEVPYETLMTAAGYMKPASKEKGAPPSSLELLLKSAKLTKDEEDQVKTFITRYLRAK